MKSLRCPLCEGGKIIHVASSVFKDVILQHTGYGFDEETIEPVMCCNCNMMFDLKTGRVLHFNYRCSGVLIGLRWI